MSDEYKLRMPYSGLDPNQITIDLKGDHKWETILIHCGKPKFTKGQRLTSMREVYEACLAGHKIKCAVGYTDDPEDYFYFDEESGIYNYKYFYNCDWDFKESEYWEVLE